MKNFIPDILNATESAARAAVTVVGYGNQDLADQLAVDAMRKNLSEAPFCSTVVIGEGERDQAPMLYIGEQLGKEKEVEIDIALDPLEGTAICANFDSGSMSVITYGAKGCFLKAPDVYMQKIAVGKGLPNNIVSLKYTLEENLQNVAKAKSIPISELVIVILKRQRHNELIRSIRKMGARIKLITDGDISAILSILLNNDYDIYMGTGGSPEGILAASALKSLGGQMEGKLILDSEEKQKRAMLMGIKDVDKIYSCNELIKNDETIFVASGVTSDKILKGVEKDNTVHSLIISKNNITRTSNCPIT